MEMKRGWINRQFAHVEREAQKWPEWMRRESDRRIQDHNVHAEATNSTSPKKTGQEFKTAGSA